MSYAPFNILEKTRELMKISGIPRNGAAQCQLIEIDANRKQSDYIFIRYSVELTERQRKNIRF